MPRPGEVPKGDFEGRCGARRDPQFPPRRASRRSTAPYKSRPPRTMIDRCPDLVPDLRSSPRSHRWNSVRNLHRRGSSRMASFAAVSSGRRWSSWCSGAWLIRALAATSRRRVRPARPGRRGPSAEGDVHALARLEPATGLILVGARPGARIEQIAGRAGRQGRTGTAPGRPRGTRAGHRPGRRWPRLRKRGPIHQRELQKQKLALEREQFDKLQKARLESAGRVLSSKALFDEITTQYKALLPSVQGKERFELELRYLGLENQNLKDTLEVRSVQIAQELAHRQRRHWKTRSWARRARIWTCSTARSSWPGQASPRRRSTPRARAGARGPGPRRRGRQRPAACPGRRLGDGRDRRGLPVRRPRG